MASMPISCLRLGSGTRTKQCCPALQGRLGLLQNQGLDLHKGLCWPEPAVGAASREQWEYPLPRHSLSLWNPTQVREQSLAQESSDQLRLPVKCDALLLS